MDSIRLQADRYFNRTLLDRKLENSELYVTFFTLQNYTFILNRIEKDYNVTLSDSYKRDVFQTMLKCFEYHPENLLLLN